MRSHRCTACDTNWPYAQQYSACPICDGATWGIDQDDVLTQEQAKAAILAHQAEVERRGKVDAFEALMIEQEVLAFREVLAALPETAVRPPYVHGKDEGDGA